MTDKIYTVGELQELLDQYSDNTHVRVNDDGMRKLPSEYYCEETGTLIL